METNATQLHDLEVTARAVIETLRTLPKYTNLQIAVFGGMAVMAYSLNPRRTKVSCTALLMWFITGLLEADPVPRM
jgi:hypothetical protein